MPLSPPTDRHPDSKDFSRLPPTLDHNYLPLSPSSDVFDRVPEDGSPPELPVRDDSSTSLSGIDTRQDLAEMVARLDDLPPPPAPVVDIRTSNLTINSDNSADF